jgi:hypothetical protein
MLKLQTWAGQKKVRRRTSFSDLLGQTMFRNHQRLGIIPSRTRQNTTSPQQARSPVLAAVLFFFVMDQVLI